MSGTALAHVGIVVSDLDRMIGFFDRALGFEVQFRFSRGGGFAGTVVGIRDARVEVAILGTERSPRQIELLCYHSHPLQSDPRRVNAPHANHIAISAADAAAAAERILSCGGTLISPVTATPDGSKRVCYARDPEGGIVELIEVIDPDHEYPTS